MSSSASIGVLLLLSLFQTEAKLVKLPLTRRKHEGKPLVGTDPVPMHGDLPNMGEYYVDVLIGGTEHALIVDTGSADVGIASVGCNGCTKKFNDPYDPFKTGHPYGCDWCSSHQTNDTSISCKTRPGTGKQCTYTIGYVDGSGFSAALWNDTFTFGSERRQEGTTGTTTGVTESVIGAMYLAKFENPKEVDGIVGFADRSVSVSGSGTPFDDLVASGDVDDVFSICLHEFGGTIYLGSDEREQADAGLLGLSETIQWTPRLNNSGYYGVEITDVLVDGVSVGVDPTVYNDGTAIVDSGSSSVTLPKTATNAIKATFAKLCRTHCLKGVCDCTSHQPLASPIWTGRCVKMTAWDIALYPMIQIKMAGGVVADYPPSNYLVNGTVFGCDGPGSFTTAFDSQPDGEGTILGDTFMRNFVVVHDRRPPQQRIGFAPVTDQNCP